MVTTRSSAAPPTDAPSQTAAESSDKSQRGRKRGRAKVTMRPREMRGDIDADSAPDDLSSSDKTNKQASVKGKKQNNSKTDETEGETPKEIAEASRKRSEMIERDRLAREARDKEEEILCQERQRQMLLFIASTRKPSHEGQERHVLASHDKYHQKHGWYRWEDEIILDLIRKVKSPDTKVLAEEKFPWRTVAEVNQRVKDLRAPDEAEV
ncbi:hypothetical protein C2857_002565 [Epichloe festucae Fl1]|uniref:Uncharacterized protein n=1 Tax=Epichloe festucae (strain Fl1) TaxID=877507 RepID=A0A7U3Q061_EPIFF|nr:hypothetical protein C2857_002565 [Epichloe festucae Fl1]